MLGKNSVLDRIWIRFGLYIGGTLIATMGLLAASVTVFNEVQYRAFYRTLPSALQAEMDELNAQDLADGPRARAIYGQYWQGDLLFGEKVSLLVGLVVCFPFGLVVGFFVSRMVTKPLASMAAAATLVATGDFSVRAAPARYKGEMAEMVGHFNQMIDALDGMARERRATTASISHELRTPLTVLRARLHGICDGVIAADATESRLLLDQVEHLGRLVDDLHTLSLAEAGQLSLHLVEQDLAALAQDTLSGHAARIRDHGVVLELTLPPVPGSARVEVDAVRMRQILVNLVENALRHARAGGWLGVDVAVDREAVRLSVSDNGPGMSEAQLANPFKRFAHAPGKTGEGSGLGLSIVHALATRQGATVQVRPREAGRGLCFTVTLARAVR
ncbi:cell wall metabolism sensor histidine kinase WalK [Pseudorhodoferax sp. Leaf274]|uniref:sensor histidine kinase n=1 Tax=Pseudorhodoferax sp. Leaf274 TaxID=1736318 RepID=UPI000702D661|nr:ATP-binding protein [Pseudorhodoferax sp. Leaf274]KQP48570.1 histidine kinase [Pseudorhodoferax sp. Leaf274]